MMHLKNAECSNSSICCGEMANGCCEMEFFHFFCGNLQMLFSSSSKVQGLSSSSSKSSIRRFSDATSASASDTFLSFSSNWVFAVVSNFPGNFFEFSGKFEFSGRIFRMYTYFAYLYSVAIIVPQTLSGN